MLEKKNAKSVYLHCAGMQLVYPASMTSIMTHTHGEAYEEYEVYEVYGTLHSWHSTIP